MSLAEVMVLAEPGGDKRFQNPICIGVDLVFNFNKILRHSTVACETRAGDELEVEEIYFVCLYNYNS